MAASPQTARWIERAEKMLDRSLRPRDGCPERLLQAMRHAVLGGGKRLRARLVYAAGRACRANLTELDAAAAAVELVHAYSLVHDDLPAMDDDSLRRGKPTVHVAFDEATAILAGDALQSLAFEVLSGSDAPAELRIALVAILAQAIGVQGMCGGQQLDMDATGRGREELPPLRNANGNIIPLDPLQLAQIHLEMLHDKKTGALIRASVAMGAIIGTDDEDLIERLDSFAMDLGKAFQIRDDILDVEADASRLGKTAGKDAAQGKLTYPSLYGLQESRRMLDELSEQMRFLLKPLGPRGVELRALAEFAVARKH